MKVRQSQSATRGTTILADQVAAFRLHRHHLADGPAADAVTIARDVCGVQSQINSAAFIQLWARNHSITRDEIENDLWKKRTLIKSSLMRQTLHLIPTDEFPIYIAALKSSRVAAALRVMERCGIGREEAEALTPIIMEALAAGPCRQPAIRAVVRPKVSKRVRSWMDKVWSILRIPVAEGLICYGNGEGNEATFVRSEHWLQARHSVISDEQARIHLLRSYLRAYGPATLRDFAHWSGMPAGEVRPLPSLLAAELEELTVDDVLCLALREDLPVLRAAGEPTSVNLLPHFDPYLLAHREKDHLLPVRHYKRVYRNQGWISPVLLVHGAVVGVWSYKIERKQMVVEIEILRGISSALKKTIAGNAESLSAFLGSPLKECRIVRS